MNVNFKLDLKISSLNCIRVLMEFNLISRLYLTRLKLIKINLENIIIILQKFRLENLDMLNFRSFD